MVGLEPVLEIPRNGFLPERGVFASVLRGELVCVETGVDSGPFSDTDKDCKLGVFAPIARFSASSRSRRRLAISASTAASLSAGLT